MKALRMLSPKGTDATALGCSRRRWCSSVVGARNADRAERARHEVDHCPYQAWCRSCVAARGKADAHFRRESEEEGVAYVATDYAFMGEKVEDDRMSEQMFANPRAQILQGSMGDKSRR